MSRVSVSEKFQQCRAEGRSAFITFITAGYKQRGDTVPLMMSLQEGGADIIELGIPFSDPQADGPTIQKAHQVGVDQGISLGDVLSMVKEAREQGLIVPVVLMGYIVIRN